MHHLISLLSLFLFTTSSNAQSLSFSNFQKIESIPKFLIYDSVLFGEDILMIGHIRENTGDINAMIIRLDKNGTILQKKSIGHPNIFERGSDIIVGSDQTIWILVNAFENNKPKVQLIQLDKKLSELKNSTIDLKNVKEGKKIIQRNEDKITVALLYRKDALNGYPVVANYSLKEETFSYIHIDYNNPTSFKTETRTDNTFLIDSNGKKKQASEKELLLMKKSADARATELNKNINNIIINKDRTILVGAENTYNFGDFWAAEVSKTGNINWEKVYEKKDDVGADVLITARFDGTKTALFGNHYRKKDNLNYNLNYVLVDKNGDEILNKIYDTGFDENLTDVILLENGYLLCGHVDIEPDKKIKGTATSVVGQKVINTNLLFMAIQKDGTLLEEIPYEKDGFQKALNILQINDKEFYILGTHTEAEHESLFLLKATMK